MDNGEIFTFFMFFYIFSLLPYKFKTTAFHILLSCHGSTMARLSRTIDVLKSNDSIVVIVPRYWMNIGRVVGFSENFIQKSDFLVLKDVKVEFFT